MSSPLAGARTCWSAAVATHLAPLDSPRIAPPLFYSSGGFWSAFSPVSHILPTLGVSVEVGTEVGADPAGEILQVGCLGEI